MFCKMLKNELSIKKVIHTSLFLFILLPALLTAGGAHMILDLNGAVENFFRQAQVPHFLQMHSGNLDREAVDRWSDEHPLVAEHQVAEMLTIDGSSIFLGPDSFSLAESVMDISFMDQNRELDFLLNLENQPADISPGGIGVPLFFMESAGLEIGDTVQVVQGDYSKRFIIEAFVRDALMNPSIIHSKRFVIHSSDYRELKTNIGTVEYLLEYQLPDQSYIQEFSADFEEAGMPASGPALTYSMFYLMNVVTEGINITIVLFVSLLFCLVAVLCLRFTILAAMEEDYREIGVMKAIGLPPKYIRRMYLLKYAVMAAAASAAGSAAAFFLSTYFSSSILLYMGESPSGWQNIVFPALASLVIFFIVTGSCMLVLRRIGRISAVQALQSAGTTADAGNKGFLPLRKFQGMGVNAVLALQDVIQRFRMYWLLGFVFFVCSFIVLVPLNFLNTIEDPSFITYLGIGRSDIRIDLHQSANIEARFQEVIQTLDSDPDIEEVGAIKTALFHVYNDDGSSSDFYVQTSSYADFPVPYLEGRAPDDSSEIALSLLNAEELGLTVGEGLTIFSEDEERQLIVSGIYQDITNGGYSSKAVFDPGDAPVLWYVINLNIREGSGVSTAEKVQEYSQDFAPARVTDTQEYINQTMGNTISQLNTAVLGILGLVFLTALLIVSLFLKMLIAKDAPENAVLKCIGFSQEHLRKQYIYKMVILLGAGIAAGTIAANTLGQSLIGLVWSGMGASQIRFIINPLQAYLFYPLGMITFVVFITFVLTSSIKHTNISQMNAE